VTDIATPAERGSFVGIVSFGSTVAPTIGPILGGALAYAAGWAWIFWFLAIASGVLLIMVVFLLPETSRGIVGDGSTPPPRWLRLPLPLPRSAMQHYPRNAPPPDHKIERYPNPLRSLAILARRDNIPIVLATGLLYVVYTCINASLSVLFIDIYSLNQWQAGLVYMPFGIGGTISTFFTGKLIDGAYRRARAAQGLPTDKAVGDDLDGFAIEKARLCVMWVPLAITAASVVAFGWVLHYEVYIAVPLVIQFIAGMVLQLDFSVSWMLSYAHTYRSHLAIANSFYQIYNTLLVDKNHRRPAAAQASSNIVRCALAAIMVAFLQNLLDAIGTGWTFTLMGGFTLLAMGLFLVDYTFGTAWRQQVLRKEKSR
jgi:MFS family permease